MYQSEHVQPLCHLLAFRTITIPYFLIFLVCGVLVGCRNQAEESRQNMHKIQIAMINYASTNKGVWPDRIEQIVADVGGQSEFDKIMKNPLTGDFPGYEYVKPIGTTKSYSEFGKQVVLYQLRDGQRDLSVKVAYADGSVTPYVPPPALPKTLIGEWTEFSSPEGKFSILFPGTPQQHSQDTTTPVGPSKLFAYFVEVPEQQKVFFASHLDYPPGQKYADKTFALEVLDGVVMGVAGAKKATVTKQSPIQLGKYHGLECLMSMEDGKKIALMRTYLVNNRLFQLIAEWSPNHEGTSDDAEKFLGSFRLTD